MVQWDRLTDMTNRMVTKTFGRAVVYTPSGGGPLTTRAVFDAAHQQIELDDGIAHNTTRPVLHVRLADLDTAPRKDDRVEVQDVTYAVTEVHPDGRGGATLYLVRR